MPNKSASLMQLDLLEIDVRLKRRRLSSSGGKPMQFSAFDREIQCETTATRKVKVKPLRFIPLDLVHHLRNSAFKEKL